MDDVLHALHKINTWDLVPPPFSKSFVSCCLAYKIKINYDGSIERYKARLAVKGYSQEFVWIMRRHLLLLQK